MKRVVVIGAGIGGLTTAAVLARAGIDITVLEAHIYPGGCAGTFYHQGYRFDAGATLAGGFYPGGPMDLLANAAGIASWQTHQVDEVMTVLLPDGSKVTRYADDRRNQEHARAFGEPALAFFKWQETTADALWDLALRLPAWPPQSLSQAAKLVSTGARWLNADLIHRLRPALLADIFRPVATHLANATPQLRQFIDGQLLISAQATSQTANALYGASAIDLPRRGVVHLAGGMGTIAATLVDAIKHHGGKVLFRHEVEKIITSHNQPIAVAVRHSGKPVEIPADLIIANLPPWNIARLLGDSAPPRLRNLPARPQTGWGAFIVYAGVDSSVIPASDPLHHQVIVREPLGEGNSIFISVSPAWDHSRAPAGHRAVTISTHTNLNPWWNLQASNPDAYQLRKQQYTELIIQAAERAIPGFRQAADLVLPGTPLAFERFTRRAWGWVGGFPQTNLFQGWAPQLAPGLWMVGDSIFPGQSTAAVALGGLRVADILLAEQFSHSRSLMETNYVPSGD